MPLSLWPFGGSGLLLLLVKIPGVTGTRVLEYFAGQTRHLLGTTLTHSSAVCLIGWFAPKIL